MTERACSEVDVVEIHTLTLSYCGGYLDFSTRLMENRVLFEQKKIQL